MIVPATLADLDAIVEIERHSFRTAWTPEAFARELATPHARLDVFRDERGLVRGFHSYWLVVPGAQDAAEVHVLSIATHPDARRRGIAGALLAHALAAGRAIGATLATLEVRRSNAPAIALYERLGFATVFVRRAYYADGEDALVMTARTAAPTSACP